MIGDLNINSFDYDNNTLVKQKIQSDFSKWIRASQTEGNQIKQIKNCKKTKTNKQDFSDGNIQNCQLLLENISWDQFLSSNAPNEAHNIR